jgi:hypothetical protein
MHNSLFLLEPVIRETRRGEFLATTGIGTPLRIGVVGATEQEARERFSASLKRWREISESEESKIADSKTSA